MKIQNHTFADEWDQFHDAIDVLFMLNADEISLDLPAPNGMG